MAIFANRDPSPEVWVQLPAMLPPARDKLVYCKHDGW